MMDDYGYDYSNYDFGDSDLWGGVSESGVGGNSEGTSPWSDITDWGDTDTWGSATESGTAGGTSGSAPSLSGLMGLLRGFGLVNDAGRPTAGSALGLGALMGLMQSRSSNAPPPVGYRGGIPQYTASRQMLPVADVNRRPGSAGRRYFSDVTFAPPGQAQPTTTLAAGGIAALAKGGDPRYLAGDTDGMADELPANIDGKQPARLSHGEFVVPADVVSHIGNGNSEAGAKRLYSMMDRIRHARTGNSKQGKQINPDKYLPA